MTGHDVELTEDELEEIAAQHEAGTWPGHTSTPIPGRPRLHDEEFETISFRLGASRIRAVDDAADRLGESRSQFLRRAVGQALEGLTSTG
ncbi:ribbon-helix-helix protein, CopG family [Arachnia propionica]|nr:ribbon-helix-helix protein, CopG family [Arachnia propionica]